MPCDEEGAIICDCGPNGLTQYQCISGEWTDVGTCDCGDWDIICMFQKLINDEMGECISYSWALAGLAGIGALVLGVAIAGR